MKNGAVVALAASLLVSLVAYSLLQSRPLKCRDHPCLGALDGLRMVDTHVGHIIDLWNFIEHLGVLRNNTIGTQIFFDVVEPGKEGPPIAMNKEWPPFNQDSSTEAFLDLTHRFLWMGYRLHSELHLFWFYAVEYFRMIAPGPLLLSTLADWDTFQPKSKASRRKPRPNAVEIDQIFNTAVRELTVDFGALCKMILEKSETSPPLAQNVSISWSESTTQLDSELVRVGIYLKRLSWWDMLMHWAGVSTALQSRAMRAYVKFLEKNTTTLRSLGDAALGIHDNIEGLRVYCTSYNAEVTTDVPEEQPSDGGSIATPESITRRVQDLQIRVENARRAGQPDYGAFFDSLTGSLRL
ncbi:hypothetical protein C8R46DRAFT_1105689 [Mycena filopes]|nr:hypothetical protein C8R46DRAFT_1105689 [Mycena filopes]